MPLFQNADPVEKMIQDGLARFAVTHPGLTAQRVVVWFEPEHEHCGLYISTDAHTPKLLPMDFDFQNFAVTDFVIQGDFNAHRQQFYAEAERLVRQTSQALPASINPKTWAVQVGYQHYNEWHRPDDVPPAA